MRCLTATAALVALLLLAPVAAAEQRYASPDGSGVSCSQAAPCTLDEAITQAGAGDEVIVGAGTYSVGATLTPESPEVHVHGDFASPMPKVIGTGMGNVPIGVPAAGGRLSYLEITHEGTKAYAASCNPGGTIDRVRLAASGSEADALTLIQECQVRDSLILAVGPKARAIHAYGYLPTTSKTLVRNVTAIATGSGSIGLDAESTDMILASSYTLDLKNSIVSGEAADLAARKGFGGRPGNIEVSHSNFDLTTAEAPATVADLGANQAAAPVFVDAANGDYREASTSPTIDAGVADQIGALDLAGSSRTLGAVPDIGAYEFVPPATAPDTSGSAQSALAAAIGSLALTPARFRAAARGAAILSAKQKAPLGTTVRYALNVASPAQFRVERALKGRRVGGRCRPVTPANRRRARCTRFVKVRGSFTHDGAAGSNAFRFSGRINGRALRPGRYRLVAEAGTSLKRAGFRVVR